MPLNISIGILWTQMFSILLKDFPHEFVIMRLTHYNTLLLFCTPWKQKT